ncbi:MAG: hypothetical protein ACJ797_12055 [Ktedonobacteraceae bacterium]
MQPVILSAAKDLSRGASPIRFVVIARWAACHPERSEGSLSRRLASSVGSELGRLSS